MKNHLERKHPEDFKSLTENRPNDEAETDVRKRGSASYAELHALCPLKKRKALFQMSIEDYKEGPVLPFNSPKAKRLHKSVFEYLIMGNHPFYEVCKPAFLRHHAIVAPNYQVASDKFYRSMLEPAYAGIR